MGIFSWFMEFVSSSDVPDSEKAKWNEVTDSDRVAGTPPASSSEIATEQGESFGSGAGYVFAAAGEDDTSSYGSGMDGIGENDTSYFESGMDGIGENDTSYFESGMDGFGEDSISVSTINPATGAPMIGGIGGIDTMGNLYGASDSFSTGTDSVFGDSFDTFGSGMDDSFGGGMNGF